jgi:hypothetical protein
VQPPITLLFHVSTKSKLRVRQYQYLGAMRMVDSKLCNEFQLILLLFLCFNGILQPLHNNMTVWNNPETLTCKRSNDESTNREVPVLESSSQVRAMARFLI